MNVVQLRRDWLANPRADLIAGLVVALALIPEAIAFSIIAGVDPQVGLYASVCIAITISFFGGRPAMISAATGAMALVMVDLVKDHGLSYLLACTILTGLLQIGVGFLKLGRYMRFVSRSVVTGFVNALAILIFLAQMPELIGTNWQTYGITAAGIAVLIFWPRVTKVIPAPLVVIVLGTAVAMLLELPIRTVGDMGKLPTALPSFSLPDVPFTLDTLKIILPVALTLTMVGLLESLLTATIVDDMTATGSNKDRECRGQGIANIVAGFFGGMAGCAMIGQSVINVSSGGRGRLSTFTAGSLLLVLILVLQSWVVQIPMAALVAVMIMVAVNTFSWASFRDARRVPFVSTLVMLTTTGVTLATHDLSQGVLAGVLLSAVFFMRKVAKMFAVDEVAGEAGARRFKVTGQLFFGSATALDAAFDGVVADAPERVIIDLTEAHLWDITAVGAIEKLVARLRRASIAVEVSGLNAASAQLFDLVNRGKAATGH